MKKKKIEANLNSPLFLLLYHSCGTLDCNNQQYIFEILPLEEDVFEKIIHVYGIFFIYLLLFGGWGYFTNIPHPLQGVFQHYTPPSPGGITAIYPPSPGGISAIYPLLYRVYFTKSPAKAYINQHKQCKPCMQSGSLCGNHSFEQGSWFH